MPPKSRCCEKYLRKAKACKRCPLGARLGKKERKRKLEKLCKRFERAA